MAMNVTFSYPDHNFDMDPWKGEQINMIPTESFPKFHSLKVIFSWCCDFIFHQYIIYIFIYLHTYLCVCDWAIYQLLKQNIMKLEIPCLLRCKWPLTKADLQKNAKWKGEVFILWKIALVSRKTKPFWIKITLAS